MANIQDRKSNFYSQCQAVRDESCAPQYLQSAGDVLIQTLAKKQAKTSTTLEEQLKIVQNFEKGFELKPNDQKGLLTLNDFQKKLNDDEVSRSSDQNQDRFDLEEIMKTAGLSRRELELSLSEKPNSTTSLLYKFAIRNMREENNEKSLELSQPNHPLNRLKEIEKECFEHLEKNYDNSVEIPEKVQRNVANDKNEESQKLRKSNSKRRKRKKKSKTTEEFSEEKKQKKIETPIATIIAKNESFSRPSLWDVKDMKKWSESKVQGCKPKTLYTIKNGKIVELKKQSDVT